MVDTVLENTNEGRGEKSDSSALVIPGDGELVAIRYRDNSSGDGDIYTLIAYVSNEKWFCNDSGQQLLEYDGDEIIEWWPLKQGTGYGTSKSIDKQPPPNDQWCVGCTPDDCPGCGA